MKYQNNSIVEYLDYLLNDGLASTAYLPKYLSNGFHKKIEIVPIIVTAILE